MGQMIDFQVTGTRNEYNSLDGHYTKTVGTLTLPYSTYTIESINDPLLKFQDETMTKIQQLNPHQLLAFDALLKAEVCQNVAIFKKEYISSYHIEKTLNIFRENIDVDYNPCTDSLFIAHGLFTENPTKLITVLYPQAEMFEIGTITINNRSYKIHLCSLPREDLSLIVDKISQLDPVKRGQIAQKIETRSIKNGFALKDALSSI